MATITAQASPPEDEARGPFTDAVPAGSTVAVGVGNIIHSDDGVGIHALRRLERDPRVPSDVIFIDGGTRGIDLLACLHNTSRLLLLDAVDAGEEAGSVIHMSGSDLQGLPGGASVHLIGVADLLASLPLVCDTQPEVHLLGIQTASTGWGTELTPPVDAALGRLVEAAVEQLVLWARTAKGRG